MKIEITTLDAKSLDRTTHRYSECLIDGREDGRQVDITIHAYAPSKVLVGGVELTHGEVWINGMLVVVKPGIEALGVHKP